MMIEQGSEKLESNHVIQWFYLENGGYHGILTAKTIGAVVMIVGWGVISELVRRFGYPVWIPVVYSTVFVLLGGYASWTNAGLIAQTEMGWTRVDVFTVIIGGVLGDIVPVLVEFSIFFALFFTTFSIGKYLNKSIMGDV